MDLLLADISIALKNNFDLEEREQEELLAEVMEFYFKNEPITRDSIPQIVNVGILYFIRLGQHEYIGSTNIKKILCVPYIFQLYSDLYFINSHEAFDHLIQSNVPPYMYLFAYSGNLNCCNLISNILQGPNSNLDTIPR